VEAKWHFWSFLQFNCVYNVCRLLTRASPLDPLGTSVPQTLWAIAPTQWKFLASPLSVVVMIRTEWRQMRVKPFHSPVSSLAHCINSKWQYTRKTMLRRRLAYLSVFLTTNGRTLFITFLCRCIGTCSTRRWLASDSESLPTSSPSVASPTPRSETKSTSSCVTSLSHDLPRLLLLVVASAPQCRGRGSWWRTACLVSNLPAHSATTCSSRLLFSFTAN